MAQDGGLTFRENRQIKDFELFASVEEDGRDAYTEKNHDIGFPIELKTSRYDFDYRNIDFKIVSSPTENTISKKLPTQYYIFSIGKDIKKDGFNDFEIHDSWFISGEQMLPWINEKLEDLKNRKRQLNLNIEELESRFLSLAGITYLELRDMKPYPKQKFFKKLHENFQFNQANEIKDLAETLKRKYSSDRSERPDSYHISLKRIIDLGAKKFGLSSHEELEFIMARLKIQYHVVKGVRWIKQELMYPSTVNFRNQ